MMAQDLSFLSGFAHGVSLSLHVRVTCLHSYSWLLSGWMFSLCGGRLFTAFACHIVTSHFDDWENSYMLSISFLTVTHGRFQRRLFPSINHVRILLLCFIICHHCSLFLIICLSCFSSSSFCIHSPSPFRPLSLFPIRASSGVYDCPIIFSSDTFPSSCSRRLPWFHRVLG